MVVVSDGAEEDVRAEAEGVIGADEPAVAESTDCAARGAR